MSTNERAFTLIEVMVVVLIIGILASITTVVVHGRVITARQEATRSTIANVENALHLFHVEQHRWPESLDDLARRPAWAKAWPAGGYLRKPPRDAWERPLVWRVPGSEGRVYDLGSLGADGEPGGEGGDQDLWAHGE
jgi:general secretion pathway protein G